MSPRVLRGPVRWPPCSASTPIRSDQACDEASAAGRRGGRGQPQRARPDRHIGRPDRPWNAPATAARPRGAKRVLPLKVSGAFHSPLMAPAVDGLHDALTGVTFADPAFPVIANASGGGGAERGRREATAGRSAHRAGPLGCLHAGRGGVRARAPVFVEIGPGTVLSGLLKRIVPGAAYGDARDRGRGGGVSRMSQPIDPARGKVAFVTGSTRGIGLRHRASAARRRRQGGRRRPGRGPGPGGGGGARRPRDRRRLRRGAGGARSRRRSRPPRRPSVRSTSWSTMPA